MGKSETHENSSSVHPYLYASLRYGEDVFTDRGHGLNIRDLTFTLMSLAKS